MYLNDNLQLLKEMYSFSTELRYNDILKVIIFITVLTGAETGGPFSELGQSHDYFPAVREKRLHSCTECRYKSVSIMHSCMKFSLCCNCTKLNSIRGVL